MNYFCYSISPFIPIIIIFIFLLIILKSASNVLIVIHGNICNATTFTIDRGSENDLFIYKSIHLIYLLVDSEQKRLERKDDDEQEMVVFFVR